MGADGWGGLEALTGGSEGELFQRVEEEEGGNKV